jgi:DNA-directed RNA polymerase subunit RPC12/RpoP
MNNHPENTCLKCSSINITFDKEFGFYKCSSCGEAWAYAQDDPDYDETPEACSRCGSTMDVGFERDRQQYFCERCLDRLG